MKKILAIALVLVMVLGILAGCNQQKNPNEGGADLAGTYDIKVWCAENITELMKTQIADFNSSNQLGITFNATVEPVGEGDAATAMTTDVEAGADLFCFAQDQTARLIQANALAELGNAATEFVKNNNDKASVTAVTSGDKLYGYPLTSDNGYFMYYDKSVISEDDIGSLEKLIAACEAAGKNFSFELENSWYTISFFFATGCVSEWQMDEAGSKFVSVSDNLNSDLGKIAAEGMKKLVTSKCYVNSSATTDFSAAIPSAVVVSGTWNYENALGLLGDNFGVAELPSFEVNGTSYHLGSFNGCKLMGVKPQSDAKKAAALNKLAQYLTGEQCQLERFQEKGWGPSNLAAQKADAVMAAPHLQALMAQNNYSRPQGQIHGSWWDIAKVIATSIKDGMAIDEALNNYQTTIEALFTVTDDVLKAWTLVGGWNGEDHWADDQAMTEQADGTWKTNQAYSFGDDAQFKVRQGKAWTNNYGMDDTGAPVKDGPNVTLAKLGLPAGNYYVVFNPTTGAISLVAA